MTDGKSANSNTAAATQGHEFGTVPETASPASSQSPPTMTTISRLIIRLSTTVSLPVTHFAWPEVQP